MLALIIVNFYNRCSWFLNTVSSKKCICQQIIWSHEKVLVGIFGQRVEFTWVSHSPVVVVVKPFLDCTQVHGPLDDGEVIWQTQLDSIDRKVERPAMLMLPHALDQGVLQELGLVGYTAWTVRWRDERRLDNPVHRLNVRLVSGRIVKHLNTHEIHFLPTKI